MCSMGFFPPPGYPCRAECWLSVGLAAWQKDYGLLCSLATSALSRPLSLPVPYFSESTKLSHQPAEVLPILLRMLSISCRPAGDFPAASNLRDPCCTPAFPSLRLSSAAQRLLLELELVLQMASPCGKRLFRPRKGRKLSSSLSFRSTSKTFLRLIVVCEGNPSKSVFENSSFLSLERRRKVLTPSKCPSSYLLYVCE